MSVSREAFELTLREFFAPLGTLLADASVAEVLVNSWNEVYVERDGVLVRTDAAFASEFDLIAALTNLAQSVSRTLDSAHPMLEAKLPDGSRVQALMPPAVLAGPCLAIRCAKTKDVSLASFVDSGLEGERLSALLRECVAQQHNTIICGGSASGKTSLLRAFITLMEPTERVITIEHVAELRTTSHHAIQLQGGDETADPSVATTLVALLRAALRMRPDRIVVGELRGGEAAELIAAMSSGLKGCIATLDSMGPEDALLALELLARKEFPNISACGLAKRIASAIDTIVHVARGPGAGRTVVRVSKVCGWTKDSRYRLEDRFRRQSC